MSTLKRKTNGAEPDNNKKQKANGSIMSFFGAPKNGGSSSSEPTMKFDKAKWVASLTDEQKKLLKLEIDTLDDSWLAVLKDEVTSKEFLELKKFLKREESARKVIFPPKEDIYSWSRYTPFHTVKVVILGQDPYHNVNQAHGLAFSVRPPTTCPPSLRNMYVGLRNDYPSFTAPPRSGGLLTPWAERGVLLLNTCLTVRAHEANSHANRGWERFTQRVIDLVAARRARGVVFMAWGTPAGKRVLKVDGQRHLVLKAVHPSPLSASRGFFTCRHFRLANEWLAEKYGPGQEIDWSLVPGKTLTELAGGGGSKKKKVDEVEAKEKENEEPVAKKDDNVKTNRTAGSKAVKPANGPDDVLTEEDEEALMALADVEEKANGKK